MLIDSTLCIYELIYLLNGFMKMAAFSTSHLVISQRLLEEKNLEVDSACCNKIAFLPEHEIWDIKYLKYRELVRQVQVLALCP